MLVYEFVMVKFLINRPIAVLTSFFALILLGAFSAFLLPISLLPPIDIPEITIRVSYPSIPALEVEQSIVSPMRMQLQQVSGLRDMQSETRDGEAIIRLTFDYGSSIDYLFVEVNEKVDMAMGYLPREVERPRVIKASASDLPVFNINLTLVDTASSSTESMLELSNLAKTVIRKRLEQLPEVALVDITGTLKPELVITPNAHRTLALGITPQQVEQAIRQSLSGLGSVRVREGQLIFDVVIEQGVKRPSDIGAIPLRFGSRIFRLDELALVQLLPARATGSFYYNGAPAICMPVVKQSSARMSNLHQSAMALVKQMEADYPQVAFSVSNDQTLILDLSMQNLKSSLVIGVLLAIGAMFFFLGDFRSPILMAVVIPVSLVISMMVFHLAKLSVNIVSLSGLILGVGMMIDNSIVVIDNIGQWRHRGMSLHDAVTGGTNEVIRPLLSSMLTTCAVFIPLVFLSGISGAMFYDQAMAVSVGLFISFMVSITLLPTVYYAINRRKQHKELKPLFHLEDRYESGFQRVFRAKRFVYILIALLLVFSPWFFSHIEKRQMPELSQVETLVSITWEQNLSHAENSARCAKLQHELKHLFVEAAAYVGRQDLLLARGLEMGENQALLYLRTTSAPNLKGLEGQVREWFSAYPQATVSFAAPETVFERVFPKSEAPLVASIASVDGSSIPSRNEINKLIDLIGQWSPRAVVRTVPEQRQLYLKLNAEAMALYGVTAQQVQSVVEVALRSRSVGRLPFEQMVIPIVFGKEPASLNSILATEYITMQKGELIPLRSVVSVEEGLGYRSLYGDKSGAFIPIYIDAPSADLERIHKELSLAGVANPKQEIRFTGDFVSSQHLVNELALVLLVSVLLLYFILAAQFESLVQPLIVLIELPIDLAGALIVLWLFGGTLNLMSMIGLVVMGGIIVNDSILKIDTINSLRRSGMPLLAAISEAGLRRLKPIVMTSLTTVLALVPLLWGSDLGSELQQPLALTTIGGMVLGTMVSLYVIPLVYWAIYRKKV